MAPSLPPLSSTGTILRSHLEKRPPDPRIHVPMPERAAEAILRVLAKKSEERFASVGEFVAELGKA